MTLERYSAVEDLTTSFGSQRPGHHSDFTGHLLPYPSTHHEGNGYAPSVTSLLAHFPTLIHDDDGTNNDEERQRLLLSFGHFEDVILKRQGVAESFFTLSKTIVGSGTLGLPFVLSTVGLVPFLGMIAVFASLNIYTMLLLVYTVELINIGFPSVGYLGWSFQGLGGCAYGPSGRLAVFIVNGFDLWGTLVAYLVVVADVAMPVIELLKSSNRHTCSESGNRSGVLTTLMCGALDFFTQRAMVIAFIALLVLPLCSLRHVRSLAFTSVLGLIAISTFVVYLSAQSLLTEFWVHWTKMLWWPQSWQSLLTGLPVIAFAFSAQFNIFSIYMSLEHRTPGRMSGVTQGSVWVSAIIFAVVAILGYLLFVDKTIQGNILSNFPIHAVGYNVVRTLFGVSVFLTIPTICFETRLMCTRLFVPDEELRPIHLVTVAAGLMGTAALVAIAVPDLAFVFGVMGSTTTTMTSFVFPPAFYLKIHQTTMAIHGVSDAEATTYPSRAVAWAMLLSGIVFVPLFTFFTIYFT